jgi:phthalate 4,5-cis-dihydrodiol dehydrogenase
MTIRIGLVGLGTAGRSLPQAVAKTTGFSFIAGADLRQEAREQYRAEFGIQTFDSVAAMCELKDIDAVYVATPNPFHAEHAIAALEHGKHVMVEKPMALTLEDCDRMIATAEKNHVKLMVAHTRSLNPPIRKMREIISSGRLGCVTQVHTLRYSPWLLRPREPGEITTDWAAAYVTAKRRTRSISRVCWAAVWCAACALMRDGGQRRIPRKEIIPRYCSLTAA